MCPCQCVIDNDISSLRVGAAGAGRYDDAGTRVKRGLNRCGGDDGVVVGAGEVRAGRDVGFRTGRLDGDVVRVEQPVATLAARCAGIDLDASHVQPVARGFDQTAVPTLRATTR